MLRPSVTIVNECDNWAMGMKKPTGLLGVTRTIARVAGVMSLTQSLIDGWNAFSGEVFSRTGVILSIVKVILTQL